MIRRALVLSALIAVAPLAASPAAAGAPKQPPDLSGEWRLDRSRSENPSPPMRGGGGWMGRGGRGGGGFPGGGGGFPRGGGGGGWGGRSGGRGDGDSFRVGNRPARLPETIRIVQAGGAVVLEDSLGAAIEAIDIRGAAAAPGDAAASVPHYAGEWKGDRLEAKRDDSRGGTVTETFTVTDKGRTLELKTKIEGRRSFSFKRVYLRSGA